MVKNGKIIVKDNAPQGTQRYIDARMKTASGRQAINSMIKSGRKYTVMVTDELLVYQADGSSKHGVAGGLSDHRTNTLIVSTNVKPIDELSDEEISNAVTLNSIGGISNAHVTRDDLKSNSNSEPETEYEKGYERAREESGMKDFESDEKNKYNPLDEDEIINGNGAHEEIHITDDESIIANYDYENQEDLGYRTEIKAMKAELEARQEYQKRPKTSGGDD